MKKVTSREPAKFVTPEQFAEWGLLFEINRRILHPLGLALAMFKDESGNISFSNKIWDYRDDPEGLLFEEGLFEQGLEKFEAMMEEWGNQKQRDRYEILGYLVQPDKKA
jgi:hypothetical protein